MRELPRIVLLVAWEPELLAGALRAVADRAEELRGLALENTALGASLDRAGCSVLDAERRGAAVAYRVAAEHMEDALADALNLWRQYDEQQNGL